MEVLPKVIFLILWSFTPGDGKVRAKIWVKVEPADAVGMEFGSSKQMYEHVAIF